MSDIHIGQVVEYHGSMIDYHGTYNVIGVPEEGDARGYMLQGDGWNDWLRHVHRDSITPLRETARS